MSDLGYTVSPNLINYNNNVNFQSALNNNNLIYMGGFEEGNEKSIYTEKGGHTWIIDGHIERQLHYTMYTREHNSELWSIIHIITIII